MRRGFSDYDTWDLDNYYTELFIASLRHLAKTAHGYPGTTEFPTYESWQKYLTDTADLFEESIKDYDNKYEMAIEYLQAEHYALKDAYKNKMWQCYLEEEKRIEELKITKQTEALTRLTHIFPTLWD